jgi:hypothetical protein
LRAPGRVMLFAFCNTSARFANGYAPAAAIAVRTALSRAGLAIAR